MTENVQKKLSPRQTKALAAFLRGDTQQEAAKSAGVSAKTVQRWQAQPDFQQALAAAGRDALRQAASQLSGGIDEAIEVMREVMKDGEQRASVRLRAAKHICDLTLRAHNLLDIEERLQKLERTEIIFRWSDNGHSEY